MKPRSKQTNGLILAGLLLILVGIAARGIPSFTLPPEAIIAMTVNAAVERPYLLRQDGRILRPDAAGQWRLMALDARVNAIHLGSGESLWAAADSGLFRYQAGQWEQVNDEASRSLSITHGYVLALGDTHLFRVSEGRLHADQRHLPLPQADAAPQQLVMLGNHSHMLRDRTALYLTESLGLGWTAIESPGAIQQIGIDAGGDLLALSEGSLWRWDWRDTGWTQGARLPDGVAVIGLDVFDGVTLLLGEGRLYRMQGETWLAENISESAYVMAIAVQYPDTLWALDALGGRLWTKQLGSAEWEAMAIVVGD